MVYLQEEHLKEDLLCNPIDLKINYDKLLMLNYEEHLKEDL